MRRASWRALPGVGRPPSFDGPMPTLDPLATRFARCVSLFRDPSAKTEQKKEFRALLGLLQDTAVTLRVAAGESGVELNGVPCEGDSLTGLVQRLELHGIGEIALPANPPPAHLFELLQALADQPRAHAVASRLAAPAAGPGGGRPAWDGGSRSAAPEERNGGALVALERASPRAGTSPCRSFSSSRSATRFSSSRARRSRCADDAHRSRGAATRCRRGTRGARAQ